VRWTHFPLHPETPDEGQTLEALFQDRAVNIAEVQQRLAEMMETEGLPYGSRTHTYNSRLAQELGKWAETQPGGEAIHKALFQAYFVGGKNVGNVTVLLDVVRELGLDEAAATEVLHGRTFSDAIDEDWQRAVGMGVTAVPTFLAGGYGVVGAQPMEALTSFLQQVGATLRA